MSAETRRKFMDSISKRGIGGSTPQEHAVLVLMNAIDPGNEWDLYVNLYGRRGRHGFRACRRVLFGRYQPDIICAPKRKIIEVTGQPWSQQGRIARYEGFGYECLIVGNDELEDPSALRKKLIEFAENGHRKELYFSTNI